jgi:hypothetical protein
MREMNKEEKIAFLTDAIATLTEMRQTVLDLMAENEARLVEINARIESVYKVTADNTAYTTRPTVTE